MPAIGDLDGARQSLRSRRPVTTATITRQDLDLGMIGELGGNGGDFPVGQQCHDPPPLKIADNRSIAMIAAKNPVIDAGHIDGFGAQAGSAPYDP